MKFTLITSIFITHLILSSFGQNNCQKDKISGIWKAIGSAAGYQNVIGNVDSLKKVVHIHRDPGFYNFQRDGNYTYSNPTIDLKRPHFHKDVYRFDENTCEIILGTKNKAYKNANLKILYIDDDYMIITDDNNPHGDYTTLYSKQ